VSSATTVELMLRQLGLCQDTAWACFADPWLQGKVTQICAKQEDQM